MSNEELIGTSQYEEVKAITHQVERSEKPTTRAGYQGIQ